MITSIDRYYVGDPNIVGIVATDNLATITAVNYWKTQIPVVAQLINGIFQWSVSDLVLIYYATNQIGFFTYDPVNLTFIELISAANVQSVSGTANEINSTGGDNPVISIANNAILPGTGGVTLPQGTTAQRAGIAGTIRFNTQTGVFESTVDGSTWATIETSATGITSITPITSANSPYTVLSTDEVITTDSSAGAITILLQNAPPSGRLVKIKDVNGSAATNAVTITTVGGVILLDASATMVLNTAWYERSFLFNGTLYLIVDTYYGPILGAPKNVNTTVGVSVGNSTFAASTTNATLVGYQSGLALLNTSTDNTFMGYLSGTAITSGVGNTIIGSQAGKSAVAVTGITAIGYQAATLAITNPVTAIGYQAGAAHTSGLRCFYAGYQAGNANQTSADNVAIGFQAFLLGTGGANTIIGSKAGTAMTTASNCVAIGTSAMLTNQTATQSVAVGSSALALMTVGPNTAVGYQAGSTISTGTANTCFGFQAGTLIDTGSGHTLIGNSAGAALTTGSTNCTAVGGNALKVSTGNSNTAVGGFSCQLLTSGINNCSVGENTLVSLLTGTRNTAIGTLAGQSYTGAESNNILLGYAVVGTLGESNVMRLASGTGTGNGQVNSCFIQGITGVTQNPSGTVSVATVLNSTSQIGVTVATLTPTASKLPLWDASINLSANNFLPGYNTFTTSQTLTVASPYSIYMTGTTASQTMTLPVTSTFAVTGGMFMFMNNSTQIWNINSSGGNLVIALPSMSMVIVECILTTGTTAASWNAMPITYGTTSGTGNTMLLQQAPTINQANLVGTTTNNNAAVGSVGEEGEVIVPVGSAISLTNTTPADVCSMILQPGDYDVWGNIGFNGNSSTLVTDLEGWINTSSASLPNAALYNGPSFGSTGVAIFAANSYGFQVPTIRVTVATATTTTIYLSGRAGFSVSTATAYGGLYWRRRR